MRGFGATTAGLGNRDATGCEGGMQCSLYNHVATSHTDRQLHVGTAYAL